MFSTDKTNATLKQIEAVKLVPPANAGDRWKGIPHKKLVEAITNRVVERGLIIAEWRFHLSRDNADLVAAAIMRRKQPPADAGPVELPAPLVPSIGVKVSNARRGAPHFYAGTVCPVTGAALVVGEWLSGRYEQDFSIVNTCKEAFHWWDGAISTVPNAVHALKAYKMPNDVAEQVLFNAGRANIMPWSRIGKVDRLWRKSGEKTAWELLRIFGGVTSINTPRDQMNQMLRFHLMLGGRLIPSKRTA